MRTWNWELYIFLVVTANAVGQLGLFIAGAHPASLTAAIVFAAIALVQFEQAMRLHSRFQRIQDNQLMMWLLTNVFPDIIRIRNEPPMVRDLFAVLWLKTMGPDVPNPGERP